MNARLLARLTSSLRAVGLRRTPARIALLERLANAEGPLAHMDLANELAPLGFDQSTIYRNLVELTKAGLLVASSRDLGARCFALSAMLRTSYRTRFVCNQCGSSRALDDVEVKLIFSKRRYEELGAQSLEIILSGRCPSCGREQAHR
jgi:Fur family ferric uptake transcriptional regulator